MTNPVRVLVGVSRCLLGEEVRFDRGHKRSRYVTDVLSAFFEYLPVCPEVEVGMGVPRESVRLVEVDAGPPRLIAPRSGTDWTPAMESLLAERVEAIAAAAPRGFIVKSKSPTCGLDRVRVYRAAGPPAADGVGMFTAALQARLPLLPIEDEGRLNDARLREHFITRVFAHDDWLRLLEAPSAAALVAFHARHKMLLM
ncbi:MAG: DUF1722 domain-containing protein, partial [Myxococcales bacterium]|nr:DUF1722 domain-containing protein [Myxococcales bacterium]